MLERKMEGSKTMVMTLRFADAVCSRGYFLIDEEGDPVATPEQTGNPWKKILDIVPINPWANNSPW